MVTQKLSSITDNYANTQGHIAGILGMEVHMIYEKGQTRGDDPGGDTGYSSKCIVQKLWTNQNKKSPIKKYIYLNGES